MGGLQARRVGNNGISWHHEYSRPRDAERRHNEDGPDDVVHTTAGLVHAVAMSDAADRKGQARRLKFALDQIRYFYAAGRVSLNEE